MNRSHVIILLAVALALAGGIDPHRDASHRTRARTLERHNDP